MFCIHILIERHKTISRGTAEFWVEPMVIVYDDGKVIPFETIEAAHSFVRSDAIDEHTYGLTVVGYEVHHFSRMPG